MTTQIDEGQTNRWSTPRSRAFDPRPYLELRVWADTYAQIQTDRIALSNRLKAGSIPVDVVTSIVDDYSHAEGMVKRAMWKSFRRASPEIAAWVKTDNAVGVGEHLIARLLGTIGHPVIALPHHWEGTGNNRKLVADEPFHRNVGKLLSYCGVGDPARTRRRGMSAEEGASLGNPAAKSLVYLIAQSCMKQTGSTPQNRPQSDRVNTDAHLTNETEDTFSAEPLIALPTPTLRARRRSPYRDVYDYGRTVYATRERWTPLHQHNAALRLTAKQVLKDIYNVALDALDRDDNLS